MRSSSSSRSSLLFVFLRDDSPDSEGRLVRDEESPLRRVEPLWERESESADLPVILLHMVAFQGVGFVWMGAGMLEDQNIALGCNRDVVE
jgi:hypothetical protein